LAFKKKFKTDYALQQRVLQARQEAAMQSLWDSVDSNCNTATVIARGFNWE